MNKFQKKDKEEAVRIISIIEEDGKNEVDLTNYSLDMVKGQSKRQKVTTYMLASTFSGLGRDFCDRAIADRILNDNVEELATGIATSARFGYLERLSGGEKYSGGYDCLHVYDLMKSLSVNDSVAISAFLKTFPGPFKKGNQSVVLLCNAVYVALENIEDTNRILEKLKSRKETKFFRAMYECLVGIITGNKKHFINNLDELLKGNRRQDFHSSMEKVICIEAHALWRLWLIRHKTKTHENIVLELPWDSKFDSFINNNSCTVPYKLNDSSTILNKWLLELPQQTRCRYIDSRNL